MLLFLFFFLFFSSQLRLYIYESGDSMKDIVLSLAVLSLVTG